MNLRQLAASSLSLLTLAALIIPTSATADTQCSDHADGRSADCTFECKEGNTLSVEVKADDSDADAIGSATCGGTSASCRGGVSCDDTSDDSVQRDDAEGKCHGETEEFWASGFHYECKSIAVGTGVNPNKVCELAPQVCDSADWAQGVATGMADYLQQNGAGFVEDCLPDVTLGKTERPEVSKERVEEEVGRYHDFASECAASYGRPDALTGLPPGVVSQVRVRVKGALSLGEVCNAGVGCWFVLPACAANPEGIIRACTVDHTSPRVEPSESLKTTLGF